MKHWRTMLIVFLGAIVCLAVWQAMRPREPSFRGRKVSQWVEIYCLQPDDAKLHLAAICSLIDLGTNAVPPILKMAGRRDLPLKKLLLKIPVPDKLLNALRLKEAYDKWANAATDWPYMASCAFVLLGRDNKTAVPGLIKLLSSDNPATRLAAVNMLMTAGINAHAALPILAGASLHDSDKRVRDGAAQTIKAIQAGQQPGSWSPSTDGLAGGGFSGYASARGIRLVTNTVAGVPSVSIRKR